MPPPSRFAISVANIDSALRYARAIELFSDIYRPDLSILEIGSGSAGITEFLDHPVVGLDARFDRTAERESRLLTRVQGDATRLPFGDATYDVIISIDMFEHLPASDRESCLAEVLRVLRPGGRCVLAFPADRAGERLDRKLNDWFRTWNKRDHPWVIEHIRCGLPKTLDVVATARRLGGNTIGIRVKRHLWGPAWLAVQWIYTVQTPILPILWRLRKSSGLRLVFDIARQLNFQPAYRTILIIDKAGN